MRRVSFFCPFFFPPLENGKVEQWDLSYRSMKVQHLCFETSVSIFRSFRIVVRSRGFHLVNTVVYQPVMAAKSM